MRDHSLVDLDARFNKGLIENCRPDIAKHCHDEVLDKDDDDEKDSDEEDTDANGK